MTAQDPVEALATALSDEQAHNLALLADAIDEEFQDYGWAADDLRKRLIAKGLHLVHEEDVARRLIQRGYETGMEWPSMVDEARRLLGIDNEGVL